MRRSLAILTLTGLVSLAACGGGSGGGSGSTGTTTPGVTTTAGGGNVITDPINRARAVVNQQNEQLRQTEQRTGQADPTIP